MARFRLSLGEQTAVSPSTTQLYPRILLHSIWLCSCEVPGWFHRAYLKVFPWHTGSTQNLGLPCSSQC